MLESHRKGPSPAQLAAAALVATSPLALVTSALGTEVPFHPPQVFELEAPGSGALLVDDYDDGGTNDILVVHGGGLEVAEIVVYLGEVPDPDAQPFEQTGTTNAGSTVDRVAVSDLNHDGLPDLVAGARGYYSGGFTSGNICGTDGNANQRFPVMRGVGDGTFALETCLKLNDSSGYTDTYFVGVAIADLDGDGHDDIAAGRSGNYGHKAVRVFFGDGAFGFTEPVTVYDSGTSGNRPTTVALGDFAGDAALDVLVATQGGTRVFEGDGARGFDEGVGYAGAWPVEPDFVNDDAYPDVTELGASDALIYYGLPDGGTEPTPQALPLVGGTQPSAVRAADLNGDQGADIFVTFRNLGENASLAVYFQDAPPPVCTDSDGDGYAIEGGACGPRDCDDSAPGVNPGATEIPGNGIDDDCDPATPGGCQPELANASITPGAARGGHGLPSDLASFSICAWVLVRRVRRRGTR